MYLDVLGDFGGDLGLEFDFVEVSRRHLEDVIERRHVLVNGDGCSHASRFL